MAGNTRNLFGLDPSVYAKTLDSDLAEVKARQEEMGFLVQPADPDEDADVPMMLNKTEPGFTLIVRGMFSQIYQEALADERRRLGKYWRPTRKLPAFNGILKPKEWNKAFNVLTASMWRAERIKRPRQGEPIELEKKGYEKVKTWLRSDAEKNRTERILWRMGEHAGEVLKLLAEQFR